ncbi:hypothetical protein [Hydrocarboniphaga effusa]|jgi:hypothetical protein|uniref:hypothetical protein n=1 Tax=Hydrocarboniphaga effusa TaxID=243629 RepID=UPI0005907609|nr:hypothetical protein [Hydrocarboniphaga effusa]MDZ4056095.1 hypothetical protein [Polynucleobacter sp.]
MEDEVAPDRGTKVTRFVCGFIFFGGIALLFIGTHFASLSCKALLLSASSVGLVAGLLAMRLGDSFWLKAKEWLP